MPVSPFERHVTERPPDPRTEQRDAPPAPEMQASPADEDDQRGGETVEEPGYGHGV